MSAREWLLVLEICIYRRRLLHLLWHLLLRLLLHERIIVVILHRSLRRILIYHRRVILVRERLRCHGLLVQLVILWWLRTGEPAGVVEEEKL